MEWGGGFAVAAGWAGCRIPGAGGGAWGGFGRLGVWGGVLPPLVLVLSLVSCPLCLSSVWAGMGACTGRDGAVTGVITMMHVWLHVALASVIGVC